MVGHRQTLELDTEWDEGLSYLLAPALASYETERLTGRRATSAPSLARHL